MDHRPSQTVFCFLPYVETSQVVSSVGSHVQVEGELQVCVDFDLTHLVVVKLESLDHDHQDVWQLFETETLRGSHFLLASLTKVSVVAVQYLSFYKTLQSFFQGFFTPNINSHRQESLLLFTIMRALVRVELVG